MHSPDATWETTLVIPETAKPIDVQTLDALLRIEEQLFAIGKAITARTVITGPEANTASQEAVEMLAEGLKPARGKRSNGK
jgi:hypothetical protein